MSRPRRLGSVALAVASVLLLLFGVLGVWGARTAFNNDVFVARVGDLGGNAAVQAALSDYLTAEVMTLIDVEGYLAEKLPPPADVLAVPLSAAVQTFVGEQVDKVLATDAFAELWRSVVGRSHKALVAVASGDTGEAVGTTADGQVQINLLPVVGRVLEELTGASPQLVNQVSGALEALANRPPGEARARLAELTGIDLPDDFGVIVIEDDGALATVQQVVNVARTVMLLLIVAFVLTAAGAIWLAEDRRRMAVGLLGTWAVLLATIRQAGKVMAESLVGNVVGAVNQEAARAVVDSVMGGLFDLLGWLLLAVVVAAVALWVTARAEAVRGLWAAATAGGSDTAGVVAPPTGWWRIAPPGSLQVLVAIAAVVALWWLGPSLLLLVLVLIAVAVSEAFMWRTSRTPRLRSGV
jgi:hypothetical protein